MTIDGFRPEDRTPFAGYRPDVAQALVRGLERLARVLRVQVDGLDNIPDGRAVLVANHAFGFDIAFAASRIAHELARPVWTLGEHAWWTVPVVRRVAAAVGIVDGTPDNADRLLSDDQLVLVLPGGLREALKSHELRYRLLWKNRYGFVRTAVRNQAPLVPVAALGAKDLLRLEGNAFGRSRRLHLPFPLPRPLHYVPIPHPTALRYVVGEPIPTTGIAVDDEAALRRLRREVEGALHEVFETELARRAKQ